jgi:hypothetical protein
MHPGKGLLADVAVAFTIQTGPLIEVFRLRGLQPQRCKHFFTALNA